MFPGESWQCDRHCGYLRDQRPDRPVVPLTNWCYWSSKMWVYSAICMKTNQCSVEYVTKFVLSLLPSSILHLLSSTLPSPSLGIRLLENICMKTNPLFWNEGLGDSLGVEVYLAPRMQVCFLVVNVVWLHSYLPIFPILLMVWFRNYQVSLPHSIFLASRHLPPLLFHHPPSLHNSPSFTSLHTILHFHTPILTSSFHPRSRHFPHSTPF